MRSRARVQVRICSIRLRTDVEKGRDHELDELPRVLVQIGVSGLFTLLITAVPY